MSSFRLLRELDPEAACDFLRSELGARMVVILGRCRIEYQGRAESMLSAGERLIVFKPDGTLLVHTAKKLKPVNWQPPGCSFQASFDEDALILTSTRDKPKEIVHIRMDDIISVQSFKLEDDEDLDLLGTEDDLQALLAERPEMIESGFKFWSRERQSRRGPMDLYGEDGQGRRVIVEVKRRAATVQDVEQIRRYVEKEKEARDVEIRGILVAPSVSEQARTYLRDLDLEWREVDWDRLRRHARTLLAAGQRTLGEWHGAKNGGDDSGA